jgi:hypothetical protein
MSGGRSTRSLWQAPETGLSCRPDSGGAAEDNVRADSFGG